MQWVFFCACSECQWPMAAPVKFLPAQAHYRCRTQQCPATWQPRHQNWPHHHQRPCLLSLSAGGRPTRGQAWIHVPLVWHRWQWHLGLLCQFLPPLFLLVTFDAHLLSFHRNWKPLWTRWWLWLSTLTGMSLSLNQWVHCIALKVTYPHSLCEL